MIKSLTKKKTNEGTIHEPLNPGSTSYNTDIQQDLDRLSQHCSSFIKAWTVDEKIKLLVKLDTFLIGEGGAARLLDKDHELEPKIRSLITLMTLGKEYFCCFCFPRYRAFDSNEAKFRYLVENKSNQVEPLLQEIYNALYDPARSEETSTSRQVTEYENILGNL